MQEIKVQEKKFAELVNWNRLALFSSVISAFCVLGWLLKYSHYGIDFTDESFYLVLISKPFAYDWSISQFGFIFHPLYQFLGGNIAVLRQINICLTFILAWWLVNNFLKVIVPDAFPGKKEQWITALSFATGSLVVFDSWLVTPNYNTLSLQSLFIVATGLLLAENKPSRSSLMGWVLIGLGGWLTFMAKPTTAGALGLCVILYLVGSRKVKLNLLMISMGVATGVLILNAFIIDGSLADYIDRLRTGGLFARYQDGGYSLSQILRLDISSRIGGVELLILTSLFLLSFLAVRLSYSVRRLIELLGHVIPIAFFIAILLLVFGEVNINFGFDRSRGLILLAIPLAAATLGFLEYRLRLFSQVTSTQKVLALIFVVFPHVFAFGSNDNYLYRGSWAGLFWVMAGLIFIAPIVRSNKKWGILLPLSLATQLIAVLLLQGGMQNPYRQTGPLRLNKHTVEIGRPGAKVILSEGYANYIKGAVALAKEAGFKAGTPVIDLSGQSPGILYAMQAESIGQPWTIGGYPGSLNLATEALKRVPCEKIGKAWILAEPGGPRSLAAELLEKFGGNLGDHYETVAFWDTPRGSGGYEKRPPQLLLKSKREISTAVQACLDQKAEPQQ